MELLAIVLTNNQPVHAFFDVEAAVRFAVRQHRPDVDVTIDLKMIEVLPWDSHLLAELHNSKWMYHVPSETTPTEYPMLYVPIA